MLYQKKRITRFWEHLRRRKQKAHVCIAITASHVLPDWMWGLLINIMILHWLEMIWLKAIMQVLIKRRKIAYNVGTVIPAVRSMSAKWRGWKRSESTLENDSGIPGRKRTELTVCSVLLRRGVCCRFRNDFPGLPRYSFHYFLHYRLHCPIIG